MSDADKFLAAIIAEPDDDLPRLVFADWLEENGDSDRAEFIRLQCAAEREPFASSQRGMMVARADRLLAANKARWSIPLIHGVQKFRRGFVEHLHISADDLIQHAGQIERAAPVTGLRLSAVADRSIRLVEIEWLARVRSLEIHNEAIGPHLRHWFRPGKFPELKSLSLRNNRLWADYVSILGGLAQQLPKLEKLDLGGNPIGDDGFAILLEASALAGLRDLKLASDGIGEDYQITELGLDAFARNRTLDRLESLVLAGHRIGDPGFIRLVSSPAARELKILDVSRTGIGETGSEWAVDLIASPYVGSLRELNLSGNTINRLAADELSVWPHLGSGCVVDLRGCTIPANAVRAFQESEFRNQFRLDEERA